MAIPEFVTQAATEAQRQQLPGAFGWQSPQPTQAAYSSPEYAPAAPMPPIQATSSMSPGPAMSQMPPEEPLNYTPGPQYSPVPPAQPPQPAAPPQELDYSPGLAMLAARYARGSQQTIPEHIGLAGEQWTQSGPGPMPGDVGSEIPNRYLPGVDDPTPEQMAIAQKNKKFRKLTPAEQYDTIANINAQSRPHQIEPSQYERAQQLADEERQNVLLDQRLAIMREGDEMEQRRANAALRAAELDKLISDRVSAATSGGDYWSSRTLGERAIDGITIGLGAMGAILGGGTNPAMDIINSQIQERLARQRETVDVLGGAFTQKRMLMGDLEAMGVSPEAQRDAVAAVLYGETEQFLRDQANKEPSSETKRKLDELANQVAQERAARQQAAVTAEHTKTMQRVPARTVGQAGGLPGLLKLAKDLQLTPAQTQQLVTAHAKEGPQGSARVLESFGMGGAMPTSTAEIATANFDLGRRVLVPSAFGGGKLWSTTEARATKAQEGLDAAAEMLANNARLKRIVLQGSRLSPDDRAEVSQIAATNAGQWRVTLGLGVMSESDKDLISPLTGESVNKMSLADREKLLEKSESLVRQSVEKYLRNLSEGPSVNAPIARPQIVTRPTR